MAMGYTGRAAGGFRTNYMLSFTSYGSTGEGFRDKALLTEWFSKMFAGSPIAALRKLTLPDNGPTPYVAVWPSPYIAIKPSQPTHPKPVNYKVTTPKKQTPEKTAPKHKPSPPKKTVPKKATPKKTAPKKTAPKKAAPKKIATKTPWWSSRSTISNAFRNGVKENIPEAFGLVKQVGNTTTSRPSQACDFKLNVFIAEHFWVSFHGKRFGRLFCIIIPNMYKL